jgi:uncharacterized protein (TIGR02145 family)
MKGFRIIPILVLIACACEKNHPPVISGITCSPERRSAGTLFALKASASDEDGNALQYHWSADGGVFTDSVNKDQTSWKSPVDGDGKTFIIKVVVSDGKLETFLDYPVELSAPVFGHISGYTFFSNCTVPVPGVVVSMNGKSTVSDQSGYFELRDIPVGTYALKATKDEFSTTSLFFNILQSLTLKVTVSMNSILHSSKVFGIVKTEDNLPLGGATVSLLNPDNSESEVTTTTNSTGFYKLLYVPFGPRKIIVRKEQTEEFGFVEVIVDALVTGPEYPLDIELTHYFLTGMLWDSRDTHQYRYKIIGTQTWMVENLAYLPSVCPSSEGTDNTSQYYVYGYQGNSVLEAKFESNFTTYGVLYNWTAAQTACPRGWHLPSDVEWKIFENYLGPDAGFRLKSIFGWINQGNGDNSTEFNIVPAGLREESNGFTDLGNRAQFWSTTPLLGHGVWTRSLFADDHLIHRLSNTLKSGLSIRCMKN